MSAEKPVLVIYDRNALYHSVLSLAEEKGVKVIDTTKGLLHVYELWVQIGCNFEMYRNKKELQVKPVTLFALQDGLEPTTP